MGMFKATMINLDGGNTRIQRQEIQNIFEEIKNTAHMMNIKAELVHFDR